MFLFCSDLKSFFCGCIDAPTIDAIAKPAFTFAHILIPVVNTSVNIIMRAIRWGTRGTRPPIFLDSGDIICYVLPHFSLYVL